MVSKWTKVVEIRRKMNSVITRLFSYITFIVIVVLLAKQDRDTTVYWLNTSVKGIFATPAFG